LEKIPFRLDELLETTHAVLSFRAQEKGLELQHRIEPGVPLSLSGDPVRLRQILVNLIGNAVKFTERGSINIEVAPGKDEAVHQEATQVLLQFAIKDTGIGIPPEKIGAIFDNFTQADSSVTRRYGGTGLGLSISRRLVNLMGGRIWVESEPQRGSTFYFTALLTVGEMEKQAPAPFPAAEPESAGEVPLLSILLAEDSEDNRLLIRTYLKQSPHHLDMAENGRLAVEKFRENHYDLVLMDMNMPIMDGYTATMTIRQWEEQEGRAPTPIIALTAFALKEDEQKSLKAGCNAHLTKPIKKKILLAALAAWGQKRPG